MNATEIIEVLKAQASEEYKLNTVRMGIPKEAFLGVPLTKIKPLVRQINKSNELAYELWQSGYHEARLLAVLVWNHKQLTFAEVDMLMSEVKSWDLCNHMCKHLIVKMVNYESMIFKWITASHPYKKRAAFVLIGTAAIKNKEISDEMLDTFLTLISEFHFDDHEHVKKGASYALREIGKKNFKYNEKALLLAYEMLEKDDKVQKWIAKDVIKELENVVKAEGRTRLISAGSKMGSHQ